MRKNIGSSVRIASVPGRIQNEHLPNISLEYYHYSNLLDVAADELMLNKH
jgi:hypothetical protein